MELVTTLVVLAAAAWFVHTLHLPARMREARLNAELASIVDSGTAELVEEKLRTEPQLVRVRTGRHLGGPFLDILLDSRRLHLRLYHDAPAPVAAGDAFARLTVLRRVDEVGWVAVFDGPGGPQRYLGWLVESAPA
jgi:hypothetical protein